MVAVDVTMYLLSLSRVRFEERACTERYVAKECEKLKLVLLVKVALFPWKIPDLGLKRKSKVYCKVETLSKTRTSTWALRKLLTRRVLLVIPDSC